MAMFALFVRLIIPSIPSSFLILDFRFQILDFVLRAYPEPFGAERLRAKRQ
jgi:hypothetical protein